MRNTQKGDTIVEMVLAFTIFSLAAAGTMSILTSGVAVTERNLETTLVQQQIDTQAELLRYIHDTQNTMWPSLIASGNLTTTPAALDLGGACPTSTTDAKFSKGFFVQPSTSSDPKTTTFSRVTIDSSSYAAPTTYAQIDYTNKKSNAIWVQAVKAEQGTNGVAAYDFYIHGCWGSVGLSSPMTLGTIVRLYEK